MRRQLAIGSVTLLLLAAGARAAPEADAPTFFRFQSVVPPLEVRSAPDGFSELGLEGYRTGEGRPGAPDLPIRTVLVAIPPDAEPRIEVRSIGRIEQRGLIPRPVAALEADPSIRLADYPAGDERLVAAARREPIRRYAADPRWYERSASYPVAVAWLGEVGVLRHQRYVEVHLAPVRYDGALRRLSIDGEIEVTVHFDGASGRDSGGVPVAESSVYEAVYRRTFANYEQGRGFRLEPQRALPARAPAETGAAGTPRWRIVTREDGVVRLDHALFVSQAPDFLAHDPATWKLTSRGVQVPLHIQQGLGDPALLEAGEWVQFYGQKLDEDPKTVLNADNGGNEDIYEVRDFSDESVYFLTVEPGAQPAMSTRAAAPGLGTPPAYFDATARAEVDDEFLPLGAADPWYWGPVLTEFDVQRTEAVPLPGLLPGNGPAQFRVHLRGVSACNSVNPDHLTRVKLKNEFGQTLLLPASDPNNVGNENVRVWDGKKLFLHDFAWTHTGLQPPLSDPVQVTVTVDDIVGCGNDVLFDWIEVDYRHSFAAIGDQLTFDYPDGDADFAVTGLAGPPSEIHVYEITGQIGSSGVVDAERLTAAQIALQSTTYTVSFHMDDQATGAPRRFVVSGAGGAAVPAGADFAPDRVSLLKEDTTPADLIVVAHPDLIESLCSEGSNPCAYDVDCTASATDRCELDPSSELAQLLAQRAGQGISSRVARIRDVEDEFNNGLAGPLAIRNLVEWTLSGGWSGTPPSFLMLLGDASWDFKAGTANGTYVPTELMLKDNDILGFFSADNLLGAVVGADSLADLAVGRVPARTLAVADTSLEKIRLYGQPASFAPWQGRALFMSDRGKDNDPFEATEFERINAIGENQVAQASGYTSDHLRYWSDNCAVPPPPPVTCDTNGMRTAIQDGINDGAVLAEFIGHGNFVLWSDDVLFCVDPANGNCNGTNDILSLTNGGMLPWLLAHNCLSGGFHAVSGVSIGEEWLHHGAGGAIAVFAPSGLGFRFLGEAVVEEVWGDLFGPAKERRLAVPVLSSLARLCATSGTPEGCQFYTLLGDPSLTLALPEVAPPTGVMAVGDNALVHLSWTASPDAVSYDVHRSRSPSAPYTKVNAVPILATSYDDAAVANGVTYYYYAVAVDANDFESRWSNQNSDCMTLGLDCVSAQPLNPLPPSPPTGLAAVDPETGGRLDLSWNANPEPDIQRYTVHFGTTPALGQSFDVLSNATALTGLVNGAVYYIAVTATNTSNLTSANSAQVTGEPSLVLGLKAPGFVGDLRLGRSGDDAQLVWGEVTTDIYDKPFATDHYEIYRGTSPQFVPDLAHRIGTSATPSYSDEGALGALEPDYHYLVRAVDAAGTGGGLGNQLPAGILDLRVAPSLASKLLLTWSPVATDFDGAPLSISHYVLYAADAPFSRADIRDGLVPILRDLILTSYALIPGAPESRYYSVLAVDARGNASPF